MEPSARFVGLAAAALLVAVAAATMMVVGEWETELLAAAALLSRPLYIVTRDAAGRHPQRTPWVPPWERTSRARRGH